ncbi:MAG: copper homeostasis protein CutC [Cryomorphaceae bacterium]|jgi:copper homeostasis protein|nr:copper homeostasis protein CutC [Cryomorphaceae bacterium]
MKVELCAASIEAVKLARELGFNRIELCQNLEQGGITPSLGMIEYAIAHGIETHVLIRHRPGNFIYAQDELEVMLRDIQICRESGASGVVIGAINTVGEIDRFFLNRVKKKAGSMQVTFHRAFDDTLDWKRSLEWLIEHEVTRVLSSGMASKAETGIPILSSMTDFAQGRIEIMAGGGINAANVAKIISETRCDAVHFSGTSKVQLDEESLFSEPVLKIDVKKVKRILEASGIDLNGEY